MKKQTNTRQNVNKSLPCKAALGERRRATATDRVITQGGGATQAAELSAKVAVPPKSPTRAQKVAVPPSRRLGRKTAPDEAPTRVRQSQDLIRTCADVPWSE